MYNKILQINNVNKTSKRLKNDVDIENHRIIQTERPALTNDMLKDYKVGKAYEYFSSGWLQEGYFLKAKSNNNNLCILRTKCSQRNNSKHLFIPPCSIPVRFVKSQYVDEFSFSTIYMLYLNRAGTTFGFPRRGWGQVKKCWIIYFR
jgi:hypothetical protein